MFRRVLKEGTMQIAAITPAISGSPIHAFRVMQASGAACCCDPITPTCEGLSWELDVFPSAEFLMENFVVPAVPPWSLVRFNAFALLAGDAALSTSAEGVTLVDTSVYYHPTGVGLVRSSRFSGRPALRIDTQFNLTTTALVSGGIPLCRIALDYYTVAIPTFQLAARFYLQIAISSTNGYGDDTTWNAVLYGQSDDNPNPISLGSGGGSKALYRVEGGALAYTNYYSFRLALVEDGTNISAYVDDVLVASADSSYLREGLDITECLVTADIACAGYSPYTYDDSSGVIFELFQFDVT